MIAGIPPLDAFTQRCRTLGVPVWAFDPVKGTVTPPELWGPMDAILASPALVGRIQTLTLGSDAPEAPMDLVPGAMLVPLANPNGFVPKATYAAVIFSESFFSSTLAHEMAAAPTLDIEGIQTGLATLVRDESATRDELAQTVMWLFADACTLQRNQAELFSCSTELCDTYEQINLLYQVAQRMSEAQQPAEFVREACSMLRDTLQFEWVAVRFGAVRRLGPTLSNELIVAGDIPQSLSRLDGLTRHLVRQDGPDLMPAVLDPGQDELATHVGAEVFVNPLSCEDELAGVLLAGNKYGADPYISTCDMQLLSASADYLSVFIHNAALYAEQQAMFMGTVRALSASIDAKDRYTRGHSERVAHLGAAIAKAMGMEPPQVERVRLAGLLHDLGKIGVPEAVLLKPGRLSEAEFELIKTHPTIGYTILKDIEPLEDVLPGVLYHHERWDGKGYPRGLKGTQIPLLGRMLAVADAFDAMSSDRAYRPRMEREHVLQEMRVGAGEQWDKNIIREFLNVDLTSYDALLERHAKLIAKAAA